MARPFNLLNKDPLKQIGLYIPSELHRKAAYKCIRKKTALSKEIRKFLEKWTKND